MQPQTTQWEQPKLSNISHEKIGVRSRQVVLATPHRSEHTGDSGGAGGVGGNSGGSGGAVATTAAGMSQWPDMLRGHRLSPAARPGSARAIWCSAARLPCLRIWSSLVTLVSARARCFSTQATFTSRETQLNSDRAARLRLCVSHISSPAPPLPCSS